jgi:hypothetical protein
MRPRWPGPSTGSSAGAEPPKPSITWAAPRSASPCNEQTTLGAKYVALDRFSLGTVYRLVPRRKEIRG